jgi:DnaJ homologue, subfamily C, member 28, conserved domain
MAIIDEQIKDAMRKGQFADLPGQGKPLKLEDDSHVPSHMRMANKILRDNDLVPDWMSEGQELDSARERLVTDIRRAAQDSHSERVEALREASKKYNSKVLSYNLKVPQGVVHKRHINFDQELSKSR